jgi:hypothetical protein
LAERGALTTILGTAITSVMPSWLVLLGYVAWKIATCCEAASLLGRLLKASVL